MAAHVLDTDPLCSLSKRIQKRYTPHLPEQTRGKVPESLHALQQQIHEQ
jgi:hypothetical protein